MMISAAILARRLSALHSASFFGIGIYMTFFPVWLQSKELGAATIGVILAIPIMTRIVATAPLMSLADRQSGPRTLLMASHAAQIVGFAVLLLTEHPVGIAVLVAALALAQAAVIPANDLVTTDAVRDHPQLHYGRIRTWGSVSFLIAGIVAGYVVDAVGPWIIVWLLAIVPLSAILATHLAVRPGPRSAPRPASAGSAAPLDKRWPKALWLVMAAAALTQASHAAVYAFGSIHWRAIGFSDTVIGYLWAVGVVAETVVFYAFGKAVGRGSTAMGLLIAGAVAAMIRFGALATDPGLIPTFALQVLHGLTFGASHLGTMAAISALAPDHVRGRAQGVLGSTIALAMACGTIMSGIIYRSVGPLVFAAMVPLGALGLIFALLATRAMAKHRSVGATG